MNRIGWIPWCLTAGAGHGPWIREATSIRRRAEIVCEKFPMLEFEIVGVYAEEPKKAGCPKCAANNYCVVFTEEKDYFYCKDCKHTWGPKP